MSVIAITLGRPPCTFRVVGRSERSAARCAEAVIYAMPRRAFPAPISISGCDRAVRERLASYLLHLQIECLCIPASGTGASEVLG